MLYIIIPIIIFLILRKTSPKAQSIGFPIFTFIINFTCGLLNLIICSFLYLVFFNVEIAPYVKNDDYLYFLIPTFITVIINMLIKKFCPINLKIFITMILPFIIGNISMFLYLSVFFNTILK